MAVETVGEVSSGAFDLPESWLSAPGALELDLGCHKGTFVVAMARAFPEARFLGVEQQRGRVEKCRAKIERLALTNTHVVQGEGLETLRDRLPAGIGDVVHVSFPDPWPKRRHQVRRMVNRDFLREVARVLKPDGSLRLMTDDEPYFIAMRDAVEGFTEFCEIKWEDGRDYPATEFQKKFAAVGKPFYRLALRRCASSNSA